mmetsp:Transcript_18517/g.34474  ORF Transcript_18517/g.34474 Transcript_18517/m.34474 type:complete len:88 (-) Transcript_18517:37-300(-)
MQVNDCKETTIRTSETCVSGSDSTFRPPRTTDPGVNDNRTIDIVHMTIESMPSSHRRRFPQEQRLSRWSLIALFGMVFVDDDGSFVW